MMIDKNALKNNDGRAVAEFVNTGTGMLVVALYSDKFPIALAFIPGEHITEQGQFVPVQGFAQSGSDDIAVDPRLANAWLEAKHQKEHRVAAETRLTKLADFVAGKMRDRDEQALVTETMAAARSGYERCLQDVVSILRGGK